MLFNQRGISIRLPVRTLLPKLLYLAGFARAQAMKVGRILRKNLLYRPYPHLDTQWRWEFPQTTREYLLKTMRVNCDYIERYPHYVFNWTGCLESKVPPLQTKLPKESRSMSHFGRGQMERPLGRP
jgi:hypothetical protein